MTTRPVHTAREVVTLAKAGEVLPIQTLWASTSQIKLYPPFRNMYGRSGPVIFRRRNGKMYVYPYRTPRDPKSATQIRRRLLWGRAIRGYSHLLGERERQAWKDWAGRNRTPAPNRNRFTGQTAFASAMYYCGLMGLETPVLPPERDGLPPAVIGITQEAAPGDDCFAFRVKHSVRNIDSMWLKVEVTPQMPTLKRKPQDPDFGFWSPDDSANFLPLRASGELYVLEGARVAVAPGQRYGIRLTLVTAKGIQGAARAWDLFKMPPDVSSAVVVNTAGQMLPDPVNQWQPRLLPVVAQWDRGEATRMRAAGQPSSWRGAEECLAMLKASCGIGPPS